MKKFNTPHNYVAPKPRPLDQTELTIPGQEISIPEIIRRLEAHIAVPVVPMDFDPPDTTIPRFKIKDLSDLSKAKVYIDYVNKKAAALSAKTEEEARNERTTKVSAKDADVVSIT